MKVLDREGRNLRLGTQVDTPYGRGTIDRFLNVNGPGRPIIRVDRGTSHPMRFSVQPEGIFLYRASDLLALTDQSGEAG